MELSEKAEELMEALWISLMEEKEDHCDVRLLKDDDVIKELVNEGYVRIRNNQMTMTEKGEEEARSCVRRHRLAERLMVDVLDLKKNLVHETSCKFEHLLHKGLDENVCILLGHPKTCPHGRQIPKGVCCKEVKKIPGKLIMPLIELGKNKKAKVAYLQTSNHTMLQKMIAMGILPKTGIVIIQRFPTYVLKIGKSQFAIDKELAEHIYVRVSKD